MAKLARSLAKPAIYTYLAPRLGFLILALLAIQYTSAFFYTLLVWDANLPQWVNWYVVQFSHFWIGIALSALAGVKAGVSVGKLLRREQWAPGPGAASSRFNGVMSILLMAVFFMLFLTGLGMTFRLYYPFSNVPYLDVRWLETHFWAAVLSAPLVLWHLGRYLGVATRVSLPIGRPRPTGGTPPSAERRRLLGFTIGGAAALSFGLNFWPLQFLRFLNGPRWEQGFPVERVLGMADNIDVAAWRLEVTGDVARPLSLTYDDILNMPMTTQTIRLSCVTGWTTVQRWTGVPVAEVLKLAGAADDFQYVDFKGASGYHFAWWRGDLVPEALLVTAVGGELISPAHGFPLRLMAPNRPGQNNVKQLVEMRVSREPTELRNGDLRIRE